jgi:hypothetical protein
VAGQHGVRRLRTGGLRITLGAREHDALRSLPAQLRPIVTGDADSDVAETIRSRLFPRAYDDDELDAEFRDLVGGGLADQRLEQLDTFSRTLQGGAHVRGRWTIDIDDDEAHAWLAVVNDTRLVLGSLVGISDEEEWSAGPDEQDPASVMLWYLGWLEEELVQSLMHSLPDDL